MRRGDHGAVPYTADLPGRWKLRVMGSEAGWSLARGVGPATIRNAVGLRKRVPRREPR
jgi:hypothetical protein